MTHPTKVDLDGEHNLLTPRERLELGAGVVLLVGSRPERGENDAPGAIMGETGFRLARAAGLDWPRGYSMFFDRVELVPRPSRRPREWPMGYARARGEVVAHAATCPNCWHADPPRDRDIVVLGLRAWASLGLPEVPHFAHVRIGTPREPGPMFWLLPRPTRRSRLWDLPETEERVGHILRLLVAVKSSRGIPVRTTT